MSFDSSPADRPKLLFLIADGMADWPVAALGDKTPLQAARTPNMDALARRSCLGLCRTVPAGMPPGSDVANMSLLGFDPAKNHTGRGPIEAAAQGLKCAPDDLIWRLNLVSTTELSEQGLMLDYSAGHINTDTAGQLIAGLSKKLGGGSFDFHPGVQYRHLLVEHQVVDGPSLAMRINPPHDILDKSIAPDLAELGKNPALLDLVRRASEILKSTASGTKATDIWPWGQGRPLSLPDFNDCYGLKGAVISAVDLVRGLGRAAGMTVLDVPGATGLLDTNYQGKAKAALEFLKQGDFVYLHLEAPDECGHAGNWQDKTASIENFDQFIVGPLLNALAGQADFLIACDHFTPVALRTHSAEPVPFLFARHNRTYAGPEAFDEQTAAQTGLIIEPGHKLLPWCLAQD